ncbi:MAG: nitrate/nitrite transporter NrtS [Actinomycetota bacterium]
MAAACREQLRDRRALRRAAVVALVVGAVLSLVNQGGRVLHGDVDPVLGVRLGLTFIVPFVVANVGAITARLPPAPPSRRPRVPPGP